VADIFTRRKRSEVMSRIRSRGNGTTEAALAAVFRELGVTGWRRHVRVPGRLKDGSRFSLRPDFIFRVARLAVFVDGCFWHGCPEHGARPSGNRKFWLAKFARNRARDRRDTRRLKSCGWKVLRLWEHELRKSARPALLRKLRRHLPTKI
jgi:DNA mismatch endonuclease (patch repair protein)